MTSPYFDILKRCNNLSDFPKLPLVLTDSEAIPGPLDTRQVGFPFYVANTLVGWMPHKLLSHLTPPFETITVHGTTGLRLDPSLKTPASRTLAVESFLKSISTHFPCLDQGWRHERYSVYGLNGPLLEIERAGVGLFGVPGSGVHINGFVHDQSLRLWISRRSKTKKTYPNLLDTLVGGGISASSTVLDTMVKEGHEEAGLDPVFTSSHAVPVGAVSFWHESERRGFMPDTEFVYDLKLPLDFVPNAVDGEVQEFLLWDVETVKASLLNGALEWTPEAALITLDFLIRRGFIKPGDADAGSYSLLVSQLHRELPFPSPL